MATPYNKRIAIYHFIVSQYQSNYYITTSLTQTSQAQFAHAHHALHAHSILCCVQQVISWSIQS